jgi:hypothetical protein
VFGIADYWLFVYHPFEVNMLMDLEDLTQDDRIKLKQLIQESEL